MRTARVLPPERGLTLIEWVARKSGASNRQVKRWLDQKRVFVNGQRVWIARHPLATGDEVEFPAAAERSPSRLTLLYEDDHYLVVDKPAGVLSNRHPRSVEALLAATHPGALAVHRLDRDTSGCLLVARTREAFDLAVPLFQEREVEKIYHALVLGQVPAGLTRMDRPVDRLEAITHVRVIRATREASYIECRLETGRTHQIRKHLQMYGFGLVGDKEYRKPGEATEPAWARGCTRHMLHAVRLGFPHPVTGVRVRAEAPVPAEMQRMAASLGLLPGPVRRGGGR